MKRHACDRACPGVARARPRRRAATRRAARGRRLNIVCPVAQRGYPVRGRRLVRYRAGFSETLIMKLPDLDAAPRNDPAGLADLHLAVVSSDMGAGDGSIAGCDATVATNGVFQYARARHLRRQRPRTRRDVHLEHRRREELHRQAARTCSRASRRSANRAAASSSRSPPPRAPWAPTAAPPPPRTRGSCGPKRSCSSWS